MDESDYRCSDDAADGDEVVAAARASIKRDVRDYILDPHYWWGVQWVE